MSQQPATNRQPSDQAILHHFGKSAWLGNQFSLPVNATASDTSEHAIALIQNPAVAADAFPAGWKALFMQLRQMQPSGSSILRFYSQPTIAAAEIQTVAPIADLGVFASTIVSVPNTAGAAQGDYVVLSNPAGAKVALWLDINANGTAPTGAAYVAAGTKKKVSIITGGSAISNGGIFQAALNAVLGYAAVDNGDGTVTATQGALGPVIAPARHNTGDTGNGSFSFASTVTGTASNLQNTYFDLNSAGNVNKYRVWMNVSSLGVAPAAGGRTLVPIAFAASATAATIGGDIATAVAALNATLDFGTAGTTTVTITNLVAGQANQMADTGSTGFAFAVTAGLGTPLSPANVRPASPNVSIAQVFSQGNFVASGGVVFDIMAAIAGGVAESELPIILDPGQSLLVTAQTSASSTNTFATCMQWCEI